MCACQLYLSNPLSYACRRSWTPMARAHAPSPQYGDKRYTLEFRKQYSYFRRQSRGTSQGHVREASCLTLNPTMIMIMIIIVIMTLPNIYSVSRDSLVWAMILRC